MIRIILLVILFISCAHDDESKPAKDDFDPNPLYEHYVDRLMSDHLTDKGWIVSWTQDGQTEHEGEGLLWNGIALGTLPCDKAAFFSEQLRDMINRNTGALVRFEPLGEYANGREITFDGATGLYFGIVAYLVRCSDDLDKWAATWGLHDAYVQRNYGYLNVNTTIAIEPQFTVLPDLIGHMLGLRGEPSSDRIRALELQVSTWAYLVKSAKEPCFRIHLGWLYLRALEHAGELSLSGRERFCRNTHGTDIPLIDHWCERQHISHWEFKKNEWEHRHQRCGKWERPDGKGYRTPALDLIQAYSEVL